NGVAHSTIRGDVRKVSTTMIKARPSHKSWACQIGSTNVGMSVWAAEYSVARPYSASATTAMTTGLSSWRTRDSTVGDDRTGGVRTGGIRAGEIRTHRVRDHRHWEGRRCGVVGNRHLQSGRRALVDAEVVRDGARHQRSDRRAVAGEPDDRAHHDRRMSRGAEGDEPHTARTS